MWPPHSCLGPPIRGKGRSGRSSHYTPWERNLSIERPGGVGDSGFIDSDT